MAIKFDELLEALDPSLDKFEEDLDSMWIIIPTERRYDTLTSSDYDEFTKKYGIFNSRQECWDKIDELAPDRWDAFIPMKIEGDSSLNESYEDLATIKVDFIVDDYKELDDIKDYLKSNFNIDLINFDKDAKYNNGTLRGPKKELARYLSTVYQGLDEDNPDMKWVEEYYPELLDESLNEDMESARDNLFYKAYYARSEVMEPILADFGYTPYTCETLEDIPQDVRRKAFSLWLKEVRELAKWHDEMDSSVYAILDLVDSSNLGESWTSDIYYDKLDFYSEEVSNYMHKSKENYNKVCDYVDNVLNKPGIGIGELTLIDIRKIYDDVVQDDRL